MPRRIIDFSAALRPSVKADPFQQHLEINCISLADTAPTMAACFPSLKKGDLRNLEIWDVEAKRVLSALGRLGSDVEADFRHLPDDCVAQAAELKAGLACFDPQPLNIVVGNTSASDACSADDYIDRRCGVRREAAQYPLARGMGIIRTKAIRHG